MKPEYISIYQFLKRFLDEDVAVKFYETQCWPNGVRCPQCDGKVRNKHANKRLNAGRGAVGKVAVVGIKFRVGRVKAFPIQTNDRQTLYDAIKANVVAGANVYADDWPVYPAVGGL